MYFLKLRDGRFFMRLSFRKDKQEGWSLERGKLNRLHLEMGDGVCDVIEKQSSS
jgi:hypothetical protein